MLPLIQMQSCAMPQPTDVDSYAPFLPRIDAPRKYQHTHDDISSFPRAFPIRTSQSHRRATAFSGSPYPPRSEHHLRRKTPSGTINAAYDASPAPPIPGPPPLKHMVVPSNQAVGSYFPSGSQLHPPQRTLTAGSQNPTHQGRVDTGAVPWAVNDGVWGQYGQPGAAIAGLQSYQPLPGGNPNSFANPYQPVIRANEYNVRAFCPPPIPANESWPFGQSGWQQPGPFPWDHQYGAQPYHGHSNPAIPDNTMVGLNLGHEVPGPAHLDYSTGLEYPFKYAQPPQLNMESLSLDPERMPNVGAHSVAPGFQPGFREKAIAQAHKAYVDLLAHLETARKTQQNGLSGSSKLFVYPKPPNPTSYTAMGRNEADASGRSIHMGDGSDSYGQTRSFESKRDYSLKGAGAHIHTAPGLPGQHAGFLDANHCHSSLRGSQMGSSYSHFSGNPHTFGQPHPVANARFSLEILNTLCEQSRWKWIDGMLLGGCLHYGLENYENALQWFSRIAAIDSSHVVAITDIAATLYCLGRQDEAEKHWLRAVKVHPAYLEAAEHLVGLLYRKRSKEAIEIISYVQQALKTPPQEATRFGQPQGVHHNYLSSHNPTHGQSANYTQDGGLVTPGFGSSGYALPGSENGRILALVHAKGTMLYSVKEINKASEAFEEAVLISIGRRVDGIHHLVRRIQSLLSPAEQSTGAAQTASNQPRQPLLLSPDKARQTSRIVFSGNGELPGLAFVADGAPKRAATQTTSNSLLSLAKIFQDAMSSGVAGPVLQRPSGVGDILTLYYLSLSLQESPSTANNVGILLAGVQQAVSNSAMTTTEASSAPGIPGVPPGSGLALALAYYQYGLRLDPKHVHLHTNLGSLLKDIGQLDLAIQMYEQAVSCDATFDIALTNLANAVKDRGRINDAIMYYRRAVKSNPDFAEAVCGLFTALNSVCDWRGRGGVFLATGHFDRWHVDEDGVLVDAQVCRQGSGLTRRVVDIVRQQLGEASQWGCNILQDDVIRALAQQLSDSCNATADEVCGWLRGWKGKAWEGSRLLRLIERATRVMLRRWYHDRISPGTSRSRYTRVRLPSSLTVPSAPTVLPFHTFTCPLGPKDIRAISQRNAIRITCSTLRSPWVPATLYPPPKPPQPHLNIGYVSSDFNNHPLAHLMQSVFGFHDPQRARAICYATTASDKSAYRQKIENEAPVFRDVSSWSPDRLVEQIVRDDIHILVNLNGYTRGARNEIFAARPAPIQMSFMGFAGTLGAEWCDYILADSTAIPPSTLRPWRHSVGIKDVFRDDSEGDSDGWVYSENIIFCRNTFFCCDHAQSCDVSERQITWEEEQKRRWKMRKELFPALPDDAIILGNFNQLYKIEPTTFRSWLRILAQVPKAVLWLLRFPELGETNLRTTARRWAGPEVAGRLVFTDVAPKSQHISRAKVCDLFLDTPECNAHTTAADVLWSSTPLLTYPRYPYKMCSRMAASILKGALPNSGEGREVASELIAGSEAEYEQMATRLAGGLTYRVADAGFGEGRGRLAETRKMLWESKWHCALFDTRRWVDDVETAYEEAWRKWVAGEGGDIHL